MVGRTEIRTDRPSPDGRPTSTGRPKDERSLKETVPKKFETILFEEIINEMKLMVHFRENSS